MPGQTRVVHLPDLTERATGGIVSKVVHQGPDIRVVLMTFDAGQELTDHQAPRPAVIHILDGAGQVALADQEVAVRAGSWIRMPADLPHAVRAEEPMTLLLTLLPNLAAIEQRA